MLHMCIIICLFHNEKFMHVSNPHNTLYGLRAYSFWHACAQGAGLARGGHGLGEPAHLRLDGVGEHAGDVVPEEDLQRCAEGSRPEAEGRGGRCEGASG